MKKNTLFVTSLLLSGILLAGCGNTSDASSSETSSYKSEAAVADYDSGFSYDDSYDYSDDVYSSEEATSGSDSSASDTSASDAAKAEHGQEARKLIRTVTLNLDTQDLDTLRDKLDSAITACGGYIESSTLNTMQNDYGSRSYYVTARIPSEKLDSFLETAGALGTITRKNIDTEDITLQYVDQKAYLESLQTEYERVTKLLESATDLDQILALESKLSDLRYQINSYQSQLRTYDNLVDYSTVYFNIDEVAYEQPVSNSVGTRISNGFKNSLYAVGTFFVDFFVAIVSDLPLLLTLAVFLVILFLIIRKIIRKVKKHNAKKAAEKQQQTLNRNYNQNPWTGCNQTGTPPANPAPDHAPDTNTDSKDK